MNTTAMNIAMRATRALGVLSSRRVGQFGQWVYVGCLPEASADWRCDHLFSSRTGWSRHPTHQDSAEFGIFFDVTKRMIALVARGHVELELFSSARSFDRGLDNLREYYARASGFR